MDLFRTATSLVSDANDWFDFLDKASYAVSWLLSRWRLKQERRQGEAERRQLQWKKEEAKMQQLPDCMLDLPYLINEAEWLSYIKDDKELAKLLAKLKSRKDDAKDLLDEFNYHYHYQLGANARDAEQSGDDFLQSITSGNTVSGILDDLNCFRNKLWGIINHRTHAEPQQFGKLLRQDTSPFYDKSKVRSLEKEVGEVLELLEVKTCSARTRQRRNGGASTSKRTRLDGTVPSASIGVPCNKEETTANVTVLAISGIGGVGKTTLARQVFSDERLKGYFDLTIWISVKGDFDVKRLTKDFIQYALKNSMQSDNLFILQQTLNEGIVKSRFFLVLDDVWDDVYAHQDNRWQEFLEPLKSAKKGSAILLTTRSQRVADLVNENRPFHLEGLPSTIFDEFFEACAFGTDHSGVNEELKPIGERIIPQLKRCPLAAETLGRLLKPKLDRKHWNWVAERELWELKQEKYDILPVLRLSYMYLPYHLRRCFLFCSIYPKGYQFDKDTLVNNWIAAGLTESEGGTLESNGCKYFEELLYRSLLKKDTNPTSSKYVMHELMHDMAQLVSKNEWFIVNGKTDLKKIPQDVRHLSIIGSSDLNESKLRELCRYKKLRSIVCYGVDSDIVTPAAECWFEVLTKIRMLGFLSCKLNYLPETIGNLKLLKYLNIGECTFEALPPSFWQLHSLRIIDAQNCHVQHDPEEFNQLGNLQIFKLRG